MEGAHSASQNTSPSPDHRQSSPTEVPEQVTNGLSRQASHTALTGCIHMQMYFEAPQNTPRTRDLVLHVAYLQCRAKLRYLEIPVSKTVHGKNAGQCTWQQCVSRKTGAWPATFKLLARLHMLGSLLLEPQEAPR